LKDGDKLPWLGESRGCYFLSARQDRRDKKLREILLAAAECETNATWTVKTPVAESSADQRKVVKGNLPTNASSAHRFIFVGTRLCVQSDVQIYFVLGGLII
jgi:hypothetical protein